jgi:phosphinothricin acetyltransferase
MPSVRPAVDSDLPALTDIYNHYIVNTPITFDVVPLVPEQRRPWFDDHSAGGRHRLLVAEDEGRLVGYATTSRFRPKAAYDTTVESSVYCRADCVRRGVGTLLYRALFETIAGEDVHQIVAGVTLPNPASLALHERLGFRPVGVFPSVGRKFDRYWDVGWFERPLRLEDREVRR